MKQFFFFALLFCLAGKGIGQGYYVKDFHVEITVNRDGSADVTEDIIVFFTEERRGIIRSIPISYSPSITDAAGPVGGRPAGAEYRIFVSDIEVVPSPMIT